MLKGLLDRLWNKPKSLSVVLLVIGKRQQGELEMHKGMITFPSRNDRLALEGYLYGGPWGKYIEYVEVGPCGNHVCLICHQPVPESWITAFTKKTLTTSTLINWFKE